MSEKKSDYLVDDVPAHMREGLNRPAQKAANRASAKTAPAKAIEHATAKEPPSEVLTRAEVKKTKAKD